MKYVSQMLINTSNVGINPYIPRTYGSRDVYELISPFSVFISYLEILKVAQIKAVRDLIQDRPSKNNTSHTVKLRYLYILLTKCEVKMA